jgi:mannose/fructose/N-acetylgalactosamine-specific phosphotransferase system component IID
MSKRSTRRGRRRLGRIARVAAAALGVTVIGLLVAHTHALNAAGAFSGTPISGVQTFVDKLKGNLVWLGGTAMGLVIAVVGIMFMAGHSRAHDVAIRTLVGLAILASISGIVA